VLQAMLKNADTVKRAVSKKDETNDPDS
jgi:hypothetical protein